MSSGNIVKDTFDSYVAGGLTKRKTVQKLARACGWHDWVSFCLNRWFAAWWRGQPSMLTLHERCSVLWTFVRWGRLEDDERRFIAEMYVESVDQARMFGAYDPSREGIW